MRLVEIKMEGFRSVADTLTLRVQDELTCLIGANEHGKSNILHAIALLTKGSFKDNDKNTSSRKSSHPSLIFKLRLNSTDRRRFLDAVKYDLESIGDLPDEDESKKTKRLLDTFLTTYSGQRELLAVHVVRNVRLLLAPRGGWMRVDPPHGIAPHVSTWFRESLPKVVLFEPGDELADSISLDDLEERNNLPFEGLLKLAGVWDEHAALFGADLAAHRLLDTAGQRLTRKLRQVWSQGKKLHFQFHYSGDQIALRIKDPVTFDAPSFRSLGFRSFLSFYLALFAETEELDPEGFILLFDEPGLHLHPQGQKDLLRELRGLAARNQLIYATHSPFLIDRNDLASVLLVTKGTTRKDRGTRVIYKPYGENWARLTEALGIVPADAFFPPDRPLLVEGGSDRVYVSTYMRLLADEIKADLNFLSIIDADRRDELPATTQMLLGAEREMVVAADGDKGGRDLEKHLRRLAGRTRSKKLTFLDLREIVGRAAKTTIEDVIPAEPWYRALETYVADVLDSGVVVDRNQIEAAAAEKGRVDAAADFLVAAGALEKRKYLSRMTIAWLLAKDDLRPPDKDAPIYRLCVAITKALQIAR